MMNLRYVLLGTICSCVIMTGKFQHSISHLVRPQEDDNPLFWDGGNGRKLTHYDEDDKKKNNQTNTTTTLAPPQYLVFKGTGPNVSVASSLLTELRPMDREYFTIRINTWHRPRQLALSLQHHSRCEGVKQIQVIWSEEGDIPPRIQNISSKVVFERHSVNSLNERFNIIKETPTLGILSMDDDVLRPCEAIDSGFFKWTRHPERMVGYDFRGHQEKSGRWKYRGLHRSGLRGYSMTLPRYAFVHRDYLFWYTISLPRSVYQTVTKRRNCEDIALSFLVSSLTGGQRPLLADRWARRAEVRMSSDNAISRSSGHTRTRNDCVNHFAQELGLKEPHKLLEIGPVQSDVNEYEMLHVSPSSAMDSLHPREVAVLNMTRPWHNLTLPHLKQIKALSGTIVRWGKSQLEMWNESHEGLFEG